jgi:hypothetical protein
VVTVRLAIANEDGTVLDLEDTRIGNSDSENVRGKVLEACFAGTDGLGIDNPVNVPNLRGDLIEESGISDRITELGLEDFGESMDREIKIDSGGMPEAVGRGEGAAWDDIMDMGVKLEGAAPGVKDAKETRAICADELFIGDQFLNRFGGSLEQGGVGRPLVVTDEAAQTLRDGKGEHEVVTWELPFHLFVQPLPALVVLAGGAMAISTGAMDAMKLATRLALIQGNPTGLGATGDDGIDDLSVCMGHCLGKAF